MKENIKLTGKLAQQVEKRHDIKRENGSLEQTMLGYTLSVDPQTGKINYEIGSTVGRNDGMYAILHTRAVLIDHLDRRWKHQFRKAINGKTAHLKPNEFISVNNIQWRITKVKINGSIKDQNGNSLSENSLKENYLSHYFSEWETYRKHIDFPLISQYDYLLLTLLDEPQNADVEISIDYEAAIEELKVVALDDQYTYNAETDTLEINK